MTIIASLLDSSLDVFAFVGSIREEPHSDGVWRNASRRSEHPLHAPKRMDFALYVRKICNWLEAKFPDNGVSSWIVEDRESPMFSPAVCRISGILVGGFLQGVARSALSYQKKYPINIAVRQKGTALMCAVSSPLLREGELHASAGIQSTEHVVAQLGKSCLVDWLPERGLVAILLDVEAAESHVAGSNFDYRFKQGKSDSWWA